MMGRGLTPGSVPNRLLRQSSEGIDSRGIVPEGLCRIDPGREPRRAARRGGLGAPATIIFSRMILGGAVSPPSVIVSGMIAATPWQGGATWAVLQYLLGLRRLGCEVYFVEPVEGRPDPGAVRYAAR